MYFYVVESDQCPYRPQNRQVGSVFALTYSLRLRSCRLIGAFVISPLPPFLIKTACTAGPLDSAGTAPLRRYYGPSRHRLVFPRFPAFAVIRGTLLPRFPGGTRTVSPVAQHALVTVLPLPPRRSEMRLQPVRPHLILPSPRTKRLGLRIIFCRGHL